MRKDDNRKDVTSSKTSDSISRQEALNYLGNQKKNQRPNRRRVLRGAIASVVATLGFSNVAVALESSETRKRRRMENKLNEFKKEVVNRYQAEEDIVKEIETHGSDVLELLSEKGHIPQPTVNALVTDDVEVDAIYEGNVFTSYLRIQTEVEDGELGINVAPEADRQYAVISDSESETVTVFDPTSENVGTEATSVPACLGANCACDSYNVVCDEQSGCYRNGKTGYSCCDCGTYNCSHICF